MSLIEMEYPNPKDQFPARILSLEDRIATLERLLSSSSLYGSGNKNAIINGGFDIWQRGGGDFVVPTGTFTRTADQWIGLATGTALTVSRQSFVPGNVIAGHESTFYMRAVVASVAGASNFAMIRHHVESARTFAGQQVTLSFWANANTAQNIALELETIFGAGGAPSAATQMFLGQVALTTEWQRHSVSFVMPSVAGKTFGTTNDGSLQFNFWMEGGTARDARTGSLGQQSGTFRFWGVQLELGGSATPFERRPIVVELALCERYFQKWLDPPLRGFVGGGGGFIAARMAMSLTTAMRVSPTVTVGASSLFDGSVGSTVASLATTYTHGEGDCKSIECDLNGTVAMNATRTCLIYKNTGAAWYFSAEL